MLVALHQPEALNEAGVHAVLVEELADELLAGHGQEALDHHVVGRDPLHEQVEVVGARLQLLGRLAQAVVEHLAPGRLEPLLHLLHARAEGLALERHHLGAEAVEERGVAGLVHQLGGQEHLDLAGGAASRNGARSAVTRSSPT